MIKFKLNGKSIEVKTSWDELSFNQYYQIFNLKDDLLQAVAICTGLSYDILKNAKIVMLDQVISAMSFLNKPAEWSGSCLQVGKYELPINHKGQFNIQFESLGQFEDMRQVMKGIKDVVTLTEAYPKFVAIYLQKIRDKEYSHGAAMEMVEEVKAMPAKEVITLGSFFYVRLTSLLNGTKTTSPNTSQNRKKSKPGLKTSRKRSGSTQQSMKSRKK